MHQPHDETSRSSSFISCPPAAFNGQRGPLPSGVGKQTSASRVLFSSAWCSNLGCVPAQASSWLGPGVPRAPSEGAQVLELCRTVACLWLWGLTAQVKLSGEIEQCWA